LLAQDWDGRILDASLFFDGLTMKYFTASLFATQVLTLAEGLNTGNTARVLISGGLMAAGGALCLAEAVKAHKAQREMNADLDYTSPETTQSIEGDGAHRAPGRRLARGV
jgi:hypothetical protein